MKIRQATHADAEGIATLLAAYMRETYDYESRVTAEIIRRDCGDAFSAMVAEDSDLKFIGFIAWSRVYDLHCGIKGGSANDLYVIPERRGQGVALALVAGAAKQIRLDGGVYIVGTAVSDPPSVKKFYDRVAACHPTTECIITAKAFQHLAGLAGRPPRDIARNLPPKEWNHTD
jgi:GNAT superfamily N-acetyltransferase